MKYGVRLSYILVCVRERDQREIREREGYTVSHKPSCLQRAEGEYMGWLFKLWHSMCVYHERVRMRWYISMSIGLYLLHIQVHNVLNDRNGVLCCQHYGDAYLLLRNHVRYRSTFASCDTSHYDVQVATCEHYCHILKCYSNR